MGEKLEVYKLVGMGLAFCSIFGSQVGVFGLVEGVFGIVVAEVELQGMERSPLPLAVSIVWYRTPTLVIHPSSQTVCRPVGDGATGNSVAMEAAKLSQREIRIAKAFLADITDGCLLFLEDQLVGLVDIGFYRQ
jgi:hypothetical protein